MDIAKICGMVALAFASPALPVPSFGQQPAPTISDDELVAREEGAVRAAIERAAPSVVRIETVGGLERVSSMLFGTGPTTGVIFDPEGFVVSSAFNFLNKPTSILVRLPNGQRKPAQLVATDHNRMLVLLKVAADTPLPVPEILPESDLHVGQWAIGVGRTFEAEEPNVAVGIISALGRIWGKAIQTDASISPSNYGGPLVDIRGRVAGVLVPLSPESNDELAGVEWYDSGIGFAIPAEFVKSLLPRLREGKDLYPGVLGISMGRDLNVGDAIIARCPPGSPAADAGLKQGDVIVEINGQPVRRAADVKMRIARLYAGDKVHIVVTRGDERLERELELVQKLAAYEIPSLGILPMRDPGDGVTVRYVFPDGPAAKAGLAAGDTITALGETGIKDGAGLRAALGQHKVGEAIQVTILREEQTKTMQVTLAPLSAATADNPPLPRSEDSPPPAEQPEEQPDVGLVELKLPGSAMKLSAIVPEDYNPAVGYGVLVWLHGPGGIDPQQFLGPWRLACRGLDLILMIPESSDPERWSPADVAVLPTALEQLRSAYNIDPQRIAFGGHESGGTASWILAMRQRELAHGVALVNAPPLGPPMENDPAQPLLVYLARTKKSAQAPLIERAIKVLQEQKVPLMLKDLGSEPRMLNAEEFAELARWIDALDRI
ncbi:MAG: PDZ domain-containing protein [Planctomycetota bacterium]